MTADIRSTNARVVANKVRLLRSDGVHAGTFVLVEGDEDRRLYGNFIDPAQCRIQIAGNRDNAIGALAILERGGFPGILAIVDTDYAALRGRAPDSPNLLFTDTHDLETMLLASPSLDRLLAERGDAGKIAAVCGGGARATLLELGKPIGYLRLLNEIEGAWIRFKDLETENFIDEHTLELDRGKLIATLRNRSSRTVTVIDDELWRRAEALQAPGHDLWHVCSGHDLVRILSVALRRALGKNNDAEVKPTQLEERLRIGFSDAHFRSTKLSADIAEWEARNPPYMVLARGAH